MKIIPKTEGLFGLNDRMEVVRLKAPNGRTAVGKITKPHIAANGYKRYTLNVNKKTVCVYQHRMLMSIFRPIEGWEELEINHKDGCKVNNDLDNLEWVTPLENMHHAKKRGLNRGNTRKLTDNQVREIRELVKTKSACSLAKQYNISKGCILKIKHGRSFKWLT